jgi:hypothetical protein
MIVPQASEAQDAAIPTDPVKLRELQEQFAAFVRAQAAATKAATSGTETASEALAAPSSPATAPTPPAKESFVAGWIVKAFAVPKDVTTIPLDSIGSFIVRRAKLTLRDHLESPTLNFFNDQVAYEYQGWFRATDKGRYTFATTMDIPPLVQASNQSDPLLRCSFILEMEGRPVITIGPFDQETASRANALRTAVGGVDLEPGFYRTRQWFACAGATIPAGKACNDALWNINEEARKELAVNCNVESYQAASRVAIVTRVKGPMDQGPKELDGTMIFHKSH